MKPKLYENVWKVNTHTFSRVIHNSPMETVGDRLKNLRLARKLTQEQVAKAIGVKQGSYTQLERGLSKSPRSANLTKLARLYGVDPDWLMTGKGSQQPVASLSDDESEMVLLFRSLSAEGRAYVLGRARNVQKDEHDHKATHRRSGDPDHSQGAPTKSDGH